MKNDKYPRSGGKTKPASNSTGHKTRRNLITGGIAAGATLPFLPGSWTRPVVQSVLLPAHAQSSPSCRVTIAGCDSTCGSPRQEIQRLVQFSLDGDCVTFSETTISGAPEANEIAITCITDDSQAQARITGPNAEVSAQQLDNCSNEPADAPPETFEDTVEVEGVLFMVTATVTKTEEPRLLSVSEIVVVPA